MRKLVLFLHLSLDGFVEGPNGEMDIGWVTTMLIWSDIVIWGAWDLSDDAQLLAICAFEPLSFAA